MADDEDFDEPEIPEYLIAEQRRGQGGRFVALRFQAVELLFVLRDAGLRTVGGQLGLPQLFTG